MSWIDSIFSSGFIVWAVIGLAVLHLYLKKTDQTFPEFVKKIIEFFNGFTEGETK